MQQEWTWAQDFGLRLVNTLYEIREPGYFYTFSNLKSYLVSPHSQHTVVGPLLVSYCLYSVTWVWLTLDYVLECEIPLSRKSNVHAGNGGPQARVSHWFALFDMQTGHHDLGTKHNIHDSVLSSSGSSLTSWLTSGQVYEQSSEDPEVRSVMGWMI